MDETAQRTLSQRLNSALYAREIELARRLLSEGAKPTENTLSAAARTGNIDIVNAVIKAGAKPDEYTLNEAVRTGKLEIVNTVLLAGSKPHKWTLAYAVGTGNIEIVKAALDAGANPDEKTLSAAVGTGNIEIVKAALDAGANPDEYTLNAAVKTGKIEIVNTVLLAGSKPHKWTLGYAAGTGNIEIVKAALDAGANPDEYTLNEAVKTGKIEIVNAVLLAGSKPHKWTLGYAVDTGNLEIVNAVIAAGALEHETDLNKRAAKGDLDGIRDQISSGARISRATLYCAIISQKSEVVKYIIERGGEAYSYHLNLAITIGDKAIAEIIKAKGATLNDDSLTIALNTKNLEMVKLLASWGAVVTKYGFEKASLDMRYRLGLYQASCDLPKDHALKKSFLEYAINGGILHEGHFDAIKDMESPYVKYVVNQYKKYILVKTCLTNYKLGEDVPKTISDFMDEKDASKLLHATLLKGDGSHADKVVAGKTAAENNGPAR